MGIWSQITGTLAKPIRAFDAGKSGRRLRGVPTSGQAINAQIRSYGKTVLARSRYLASNNPYAASAKEEFAAALVGAGIKPSSLVTDPDLKKAIAETWLDWTDEADADGLTDFYGLQSVIAAEMFEAGECFVRIRPRLPEDGLTVPLQLQVLPAEMLDLNHNDNLAGRNIVMGIEFNGIGRRTAYHFYRDHPEDIQQRGIGNEKTIVPASEVLHLFRPVRAGQVRGIPHTLASIVTAAIMDCYDDAELERKRTTALFAAFITRPRIDGDSPLINADGTVAGETPSLSVPTDSIPLEPGATIDLELGEDVKFASPADVGGNYDAFQYRNLTRMAAGFGVTYAGMTGDLRETSYASDRSGQVRFRRRIESMQHHVMVYQFCRPVWQRWFADAVMAGALPVSPSAFTANPREAMRAKWMTPHWQWVDPEKDLQAEKLAVDNGFKSRSDVIEAMGYDREEIDERRAADKASDESFGLISGEPPPPEPALETPSPGQE